MMRLLKASLLAAAILSTFIAHGQEEGLTVEGRVTIVGRKPTAQPQDNSNVVVWLEPLFRSMPTALPTHSVNAGKFQLVQKGKQFEPHLLVVPVGSMVAFPNRDPFFHNVFSLFEGKRFDLGLYESGATRSVRFDRAGICYIFCNIHAEMSAVVLVLKTPYFGISGHAGDFKIPDVPSGRYQLKVWNERSLPKVLDVLTREVTISQGSVSLGDLQVDEKGYVQMPHKNLYGQDYVPPAPQGSVYDHR
jgi:plastocyanin